MDDHEILLTQARDHVEQSKRLLAQIEQSQIAAREQVEKCQQQLAELLERVARVRFVTLYQPDP